MGSASDLPYWQVNVPEHEREASCPEFLQNLSAKDRGILSTPDSAYVPIPWDGVVRIVADNRLQDFKRVPSELRRYLEYNYHLRRTYGSVMEYMLRERLGWSAPTVPVGKRPFECEEDVKILVNDWPYGLDERIKHLVVWTKFKIEEDPDTGDLMDGARKEVDEFVRRVFCARLPSDRCIWFKNWVALKSILAVEHFHVMLFDPDPDFIRELTGGDVAQRGKFTEA